MQALFNYSPDQHASIQSALLALDDPGNGLFASTCLTSSGWFAKFVWPDSPPLAEQELAVRVTDFERRYPMATHVREGSPEWTSVFHGWQSDEKSARAVDSAFRKYFEGRVTWVESERDARGRIAAQCMVKDLLQVQRATSDSAMDKIIEQSMVRRAERAGFVSLQLFWRDCTALPPGPISKSDGELFSASTQEIFRWAGRRIQPILDALYEKLSSLYGDRFRSLYVFGSYALPDAGIYLGEDSDLDVALILSDFDNLYEERKRFSDIVYDLSLEHSLAISVVPIREADYKEGRTNFTRVISEYAIPAK